MRTTSTALKRASRDILRFILDTIAPPDSEIRRIEKLGPDGFAREALPALPSDIRGDVNDIAALYRYKCPIVHRALVEIKDRPNRQIAEMLGAHLYTFLASELSMLSHTGFLDRPLVVPLPIGAKKRRERGWNQCELILEGFKKADSRGLFEPRADLLIKSRETEDQVGKSRAERHENIRDCFSVTDPKGLRGRDVIIFDDIVTTGATLREARTVLERAGARTVVCTAIAH